MNTIYYKGLGDYSDNHRRPSDPTIGNVFFNEIPERNGILVFGAARIAKSQYQKDKKAKYKESNELNLEDDEIQNYKNGSIRRQ